MTRKRSEMHRGGSSATRTAFGAPIALLLVLVACSSAALAAPQSRDQQRCLNDLAKSGADVAKAQGKAAWKCVHYAARGLTTKLGDPGDTLTAQACLTNDVGGKVALKMQHTVAMDLKHCQAPATPAFAYAGPTSVNTAASSAAQQIASAIFGPNLDTAIVNDDLDHIGAQCQEEVLKDAYRIVDDMWRIARGSVKDGLKGHRRFAGASPDLPAHSRDNLESEVLAQSLEDSKGKIQDEVDRLVLRAPTRCAGAATPLAQLFPGACAASATPAALAACVADVARGHFYQGTSSAFGMPIDCDLTDDGVHDASCVSPAQRRHLLDRLGYGADAYTVSRIQALGLNGYIDEQLNPAAIDDSAVESALASEYPSLALNVVEVRTCYPNTVGGGSCPGIPGAKRNDVPKEMEESEIYRAVASHRQLQAVLVDFWFNHFNVTGSASVQKWNTPSYLRDSIRPWVLGNFQESVIRMARGSAMLDYLDQRENQIGVPPGTGYNENFPRELLELHTMGVTGGYTEMDVKEMARALTGWREEWNNAANFSPGYPGYRYQDTRHDHLGAKTILGTVIDEPFAGEQEGVQGIALAARHPSTASFICTKLVRRFVQEDAPYMLVDRCAETFLSHLDDPDQLKLMMAQLFKSKEFQLFPEYRHSKVKKPVVLVPSLMRALGVNPNPASLNYTELRNTLTDLGERIRNADPPTGYSDRSIFWASPGAMVQHFNLIDAKSELYAATWGVSGALPAADIVDDVAAVLFPVDGVSPASRTAAISYLGTIAATNAQKVEQAGAFLLSTSDFLTY